MDQKTEALNSSIVAPVTGKPLNGELELKPPQDSHCWTDNSLIDTGYNLGYLPCLSGATSVAHNSYIHDMGYYANDIVICVSI